MSSEKVNSQGDGKTSFCVVVVTVEGATLRVVNSGRRFSIFSLTEQPRLL
jgi:hypothetical protein